MGTTPARCGVAVLAGGERAPDGPLPVCEVGSGPSGLARWTDRSIIGVDPGEDELHVDHVPAPNLRRVVGTGAALPLDDASMVATVAVDTMEHVMPGERAATIAEMVRVTRPAAGSSSSGRQDLRPQKPIAGCSIRSTLGEPASLGDLAE